MLSPCILADLKKESIVKMLYNSSSVPKTEFQRSKLLEFFKHEILPGLVLTKWLI